MDDLDRLAASAEEQAKAENDNDDFVPEVVQVIPKEPGAAAMGSAAMALQFLKMLIAGKWPHIVFENEEWLEVQKALAVVLEESGGELPEWLLPYQSHLKLAACFAGMGFSAYMQHMAYKESVLQEAGEVVQGAESDKAG